MSAPKGNQYWRLADPEKIGRNRIFESPTDLWNQAIEYFVYIDENPIEVVEEETGSNGHKKKTKKLQRPYTWDGLYIYLGISHLDFYKERKEFLGVIEHLDKIIRNNKFEGASSGIFNSNIIARDLGLKDKKELSGQVQTTPIDKIEVTYDVADETSS